MPQNEQNEQQLRKRGVHLHIHWHIFEDIMSSHVENFCSVVHCLTPLPIKGDNEIKTGKVILKNLKSGKEISVAIESLSDEIKKIIWKYSQCCEV